MPIVARSVRALLALLVVGVFMTITAVMALYPLFAKGNVELNAYADFFAKTASVYTGIVGVIIGYYFGRSHQPDAQQGPVAAKSVSPSPTSRPEVSLPERVRPD